MADSYKICEICGFSSPVISEVEMAAKKILVVDDEPSVRDLLATWLNFAGYETCTASNGNEGLKTFHEQRPDLVLSDVLMPGMNGHEFCEMLRKVSAVPVIMLTGLGQFDQEQEKVQRLNLGISAFLSKPLRMREFLDTVGSLLASEPSSSVPSSR
jgi:DNA-binding response OmpR family regulator